MAGFKDNALERRNASIAAKQALLEKFKAQPPPDDPTLQQRLAERRAIAIAREERAAERKIARDAELARLALIREAEEEAKRREEEDLLRKQAEQKLREEEARAELKAARDARYAARKARVMRKLR